MAKIVDDNFVSVRKDGFAWVSGLTKEGKVASVILSPESVEELINQRKKKLSDLEREESFRLLRSTFALLRSVILSGEEMTDNIRGAINIAQEKIEEMESCS